MLCTVLLSFCCSFFLAGFISFFGTDDLYKIINPITTNITPPLAININSSNGSKKKIERKKNNKIIYRFGKFILNTIL